MWPNPAPIELDPTFIEVHGNAPIFFNGAGWGPLSRVRLMQKAFLKIMLWKALASKGYGYIRELTVVQKLSLQHSSEHTNASVGVTYVARMGWLIHTLEQYKI